MGQAKRKHVATGAPRGGRRLGAGRRQGAPNSLAYGEVKAICVANLRVPEGAAPEAAALADRAQQRLIDVMEEGVGAFQASHVLKAATRIREEICGPLAQKLDVSGTQVVFHISGIERGQDAG